MKRLFLVLALALIAGAAPATPARAADSPPLGAGAFGYDVSSPDIQAGARSQAGGAEVEDLTFAPADGAARIHANFVQPAKPNGSAILFVHWLGDPETTNLTEFKPDALALASKGTASLLVDAPWAQPDWFEKGRTPSSDYGDSIAEVKNLRRSLDVLVALAKPDPAKVAFVGHDFGAMYGAILAGVDPRPQYYVYMAGTATLSEWFLLGQKPADPPAFVTQMQPLDPIRYLPEAKARGYLVQFSNNDHYIPQARAQAFAGAVPEPKEVKYYQVDHSLKTADATADRLAWLESQLDGATGAGAAAAGVGAPAAAPAMDWALSPAQISSACKYELSKARHAVNALAASKAAPTFANVVVPLENLNADLNDRLATATFLSQVAVEKKVRDAGLTCATDVNAFYTDEAAIPAIYRALVAVQHGQTARTAADKMLLTLWLQQYQQSGAALPTAKRTEFIKLSKQLTDVQNRYNQNYADDATTITITQSEAAGLAPDFVAHLKAAPSGGYVVPVNDSTYPQFMTSASDEGARKKYYYAANNIQVPQNVELLQQAIAIRDRLAHLMGYPSWAAYQLANRVVQNPQDIQAFLAQLDAHLLPAAQRDIAALTALKASQTGNPQAVLNSWDVAYYQKVRDKTQYSVDQEEVRQYFPAPHVVDAILGIYQRILGVTFAPVKPANAWSPDVTEFSVTDTASGKYIGSFLLDLYPRPGKPGGAFNNPILPIRTNPDGTTRPPVSAIVVSDWPAPAGPGQPALLTHDDVVTFFHEFGHCMAALLATVPYETLSSFNSDFVEAPSQMLENFTWDPAILKQLSSNVKTGDPMPDALAAKLIAARCATDRVCNAYAATRQLLYSIVDMKYHTSGPHVDSTALWYAVAKSDTPMALPPGVHPQAQFGHLMGGYDAGYYVYLWSLVYAQDMFTAFASGGLENPQVGMRYRQTILAPARIYDPRVEVKNFLGRPMSTDAFYKGFDHS